MLEVLQYIFSSVWVWSGTVVLLALLVGAAASFAPLAGFLTINKTNKE